MSLFSKTGVKVKVIRLSGGKDPDEIIKTHGKEMFSKLLDKADNDTEYKLSKLREKYIVETDDGKLNFLREASKLLVYSDSIERDVYAMRLADELGVSKDAILQQISQLARKENYRKAKTELQTAQKQVQALEMAADPQRAKNKRAAKAEDVLIITLLNNGAFYNKLKDRLSEDIFATPVNKRVFQVITTRLVNNESVDISQLSQYLTSEEVSAVARLLAKQAMVSNTLSECYDCITVLEEEKAKREAPEPSQMSDESFLEFFNSLKKDNDV
jgi:DNA primase